MFKATQLDQSQRNIWAACIGNFFLSGTSCHFEIKSMYI